MPEQKIILSVISQVSATIKDEDLLAFLKMVNGELTTLIDKHDIIVASEIANDTPEIIYPIGNYEPGV
jgi:hypothetical protein